MTDDELRSMLSASKREAHRAIFQQYSNYVYTIVYSKLRSCGTAEDVEECVSDVFAEVFLHFDTHREGSLQGYIGVVAKRMAVNAFHRLSGNASRMISLEDMSIELRTQEDIAQEYEQKTVRSLLLQKIQSLGEPDASIVIQKYYYRRNSTEIGKMLSLSPAAVRKRCERAMKRLKTMLEKEELYEAESKSG